MALLERIQFDRKCDHLWFVGDLINRGPKSLEVMQWITDNEDVVTMVLGNHDLHFLARANGVAKNKKNDTLDSLLSNDQCTYYVEWLRKQPWLHVQDSWAMVHAGLHPHWSIKTAISISYGLQKAMQTNHWTDLLKRSSVANKTAWTNSLKDSHRQSIEVSWLTTARMITKNLCLDTEYKLSPNQSPSHLQPWFSAKDPLWTKEHRILFGHWSTLGHTKQKHYISLDSGCVWGRQLTAYRLEDNQSFSVNAVEKLQK